MKFKLEWEEAEPRGSAGDATWGRLIVWVGGKVAWGTAASGEVRGYLCTWVDILEHLSEVWTYLCFEDGWPCGLPSQDPRDYSVRVRDHLDRLSPSARSSAESELHEYRTRHDLCRGMPGVVLPSLWVVREGLGAWVSSGETSIRGTIRGVLETLESLGDAVAARLNRLADERAREAVEDWNARNSMTLEEKVAVATGLAPNLLRTVSNGQIAQVFGADDAFELNETMAAARMTGAGAGLDTLRLIVDQLRNLRSNSTTQIDELSEQAMRQLKDGAPFSIPAQQGYVVAQWLRVQLGISKSDPIDPRALLQKWNVEIIEHDFRDARIEAVGVWGRKRGPAIMLNSTTAQPSVRQRATLAHEICHLLLDRHDALPLAEVLGGAVPKTQEQRASAFAAELLVPRIAAAEHFEKENDPAAALLRLEKHYGASRELIAWQVHNSEVPLPRTTMECLRSHVSRPDRFYMGV